MKEEMVQRVADHKQVYLYSYNSHETEAELCRMEMRALFGGSVLYRTESLLLSSRQIEPDRSPFMTLRMDIRIMARSVEELAVQAGTMEAIVSGHSFKVVFIKSGDSYTYDEQRAFERVVGSRIPGRREMKKPDMTLGLIAVQGTWMLGICRFPERAWHAHIHKPQNYSTGLSAKAARALVNVMAPVVHGVRAVDPCCGMGNVLIEALSMGLDIRGRDINPLAIRGARTNLLHYGYKAELVTLGDMNELQGRFDAAMVDMPYNLCSVLPVEEQERMLSSLYRLAPRAVVVSTEEEVRERIMLAGYRISDECTLRKGSFVRHVWLCEAT